MKERAGDLQAQVKGFDGEPDVLAKIAQMPRATGPWRLTSTNWVHDVAPDPTPRTWYDMPAYATPGKSMVGHRWSRGAF